MQNVVTNTFIYFQNKDEQTLKTSETPSEHYSSRETRRFL